MYNNKLYTPLRYPGGKARFAPLLSALVAENNLSSGHYVEPYAGGAGAALELLFHGDVSEIHINDADPAVYAFWLAATRHTGALVDLVNRTPISIREWHRWQGVMKRTRRSSTVERGFATLFMNRTNRSGILKGGVIGGQKQDGKYRLDARFNRDTIIERLLMIAEHRDKIHVHCEDALEFLHRIHELTPTKTLIFLDPPYYVKGQGLYRNFYAHNDHVSVSRFLFSKKFKRPWVVSYDNAPAIRQMYKSAQSLRYDLSYSAQDKYLGAELMFFSPKLRVPAGLSIEALCWKRPPAFYSRQRAKKTDRAQNATANRR